LFRFNHQVTCCCALGSLLWAQVVTSIPTSSLPENLTIGGGEVDTRPSILNGELEEGESADRRSGQILWLRGLTRLQTQVCLFCFLKTICHAIQLGKNVAFDTLFHTSILKWGHFNSLKNESFSTERH
jgi:hypothetical protein